MLSSDCDAAQMFGIDARRRFDIVGNLPLEVATKIFSYLPAWSLARSATVSRAWRDVASDDLLWRRHGLRPWQRGERPRVSWGAKWQSISANDFKSRIVPLWKR